MLNESFIENINVNNIVRYEFSDYENDAKNRLCLKNKLYEYIKNKKASVLIVHGIEVYDELEIVSEYDILAPEYETKTTLCIKKFIKNKDMAIVISFKNKKDLLTYKLMF